MRGEKLIITVSVTGSFGDRSTHGLPITPKEIAESALEAYRAGAAIAYIHLRDAETGKPASSNKTLIEKAVAIIKVLDREPATP